MAKKKNQFTDALNHFLSVSVDLRHLVTFLPWQMKMAHGPIKKSLDILEEKGIRNNFGPMTGSSIIDIFHDGEYVIRAPGGKRVTRGDDIMSLVAELEGRFNGTVLVTLHEELERLLKNVYGTFRYQLRNDITIRDKKRFHNANPNAVKQEGTLPYYRAYAKWSCRRDCETALKVFQAELAWDKTVIDGWYGMDWITVARALGFCRHCIVHADGRVNADEWAKLNPEQKEFVNSLMRQSLITGEQHILPEKRITDEFLEAVTSFVYGLYVLLSERCVMKVNVNPWNPRKVDSVSAPR